MTDVFISYASEDREHAARLADALNRHGWSVWWDRQIGIGESFDHAIERALEAAGCTVVMWSNNSVASEWVRNEAAVAAERGVLLPALIEAVRPPLEFRRKQTADLVGWQGKDDHAGFVALCAGIARTLGDQPPPVATIESIPPARSVRAVSGIVLAIAITLGIGLAALGPWCNPAPDAGPLERTSPGDQGTTESQPALAERVVGAYFGDVMADAKGSSRSDVTVTIAKVGPNRVSVDSDYPRIGHVEITLTRVGTTLQNADGSTIFLIDLAQQPPTLQLTVNGEVAYSGRRLR